MELLTNKASKIYLEGESGWGVTATWTLNGVDKGAIAATWVEAEAAWEVSLPYFIEEAKVAVTWAGTIPVTGAFTKTDTYNVVRPILSLKEVKEIAEGISDEEAVRLESAVRHIIQAHTGQSFGLTTKTLVVEGHGEYALRLPERLVSIAGLSTLTATLNPNSTIIVSDGWYLKKGWSEEVLPLTTESTYWSGSDVANALPGEPGYEKPGHGHVIYAPSAGPNPTRWRDDYPFTITGKWGYESVPEAVKEAARLLINDYGCREAIYRDRYLESIKAADWRLQFSSQAWEHTGNVRADQLLAEYVLLDWAVI